MRGTLLAAVLCAALLQGCSRKEEGPVAAPNPTRPSEAPPAPLAPGAVRVTLVDANDRPMREARLANLPDSAFDGQGKLREEAAAASPDRLRIRVEGSGPGAPGTVTVASSGSKPALVLPLNGPPEQRVTPPFLLGGDLEDTLGARGNLLFGQVGGGVEIRYRDAVASLKIGPAAVHEIPLRFVVVGTGVAPAAEIERAVGLRVAQANAVWEPFGRRFKLGSIAQVDNVRGLFLIRGRAAGADGQGRPSRCGVLLDGREASVPASWRNDGAPMTPKAAARALTEKIGKAFQIDLFDGLFAGDREALVVRVRRRDGTTAAVEPLADGNDVAQAVTPLTFDPRGGVEASPSASTLSLHEVALLLSGRVAPSDGIDIFIAPDLHSLQVRRAFKVYPDGVFPAPLGGAVLVSWAIVDGSGKFPYALARALGELLLPPGARPAPEDTLFAEPLSESSGVAAHKRVTAATGLRIAERGRGLAGKK